MDFGVFGIRFAVALGLGAAIGFEREYGNHPAGLRTNALVAGGAALFALAVADMAQGDAARVLAQIVTGVGFLGGGVILRDGMNVKGLTTAATLWCAAAVGMLAGVGMLVPAAVAAVAVLVTNYALHPVSLWISHRKPESAYLLTAVCRPSDHATALPGDMSAEVEKVLLAAAAERGWMIGPVSIVRVKDPPGVEVRIELLLKRGQREVLESLAAELTTHPEIASVRWERTQASNAPG